MKRRELYRSAAELLSLTGSAAALLDAAAAAMAGRPSSIDWGDAAPVLAQDDALGQIYQAINAPALEAAYRATARNGRKFSSAEIPAVTQLFTPKWVVEFLLQNTLGRLWRDMHPDTQLPDSWRWLVPNESAAESPRRAIDLRICDPACGTMNFGLVAIDMLRQIYREEINRAGSPGWPQPSCLTPDLIDESIVRHNLIGFDIDPIAIDLARRSLEIKIGQKIHRHQLSVADALFDRHIRGGFDVIVTNPPYLSARNLDAHLVARMKKRYPAAWRDAYACFIQRSLDLIRPGGRCGILSMHSFMFTSAFQRLRKELTDAATLQTAAHFGPGLFEVGNPGTLQTVAMVLQRAPAPRQKAIFFRLADAQDKQSALHDAIQIGGHFHLSQEDLSLLPRGAWMYWLDPPQQTAFRNLPKLGDMAPPRQGLATTDNRRFVRYWWEVEAPGFSGLRKKWMPYAKGGRFRRWYESARHRVNWEDDGRQIKQAIVQRYPYLNGQWKWVAKNSSWYGKPGITYSYLTSRTFSARRLEPGTIFDVAGSSLFPDDPLAVLGILNSSTAQRLLQAINPTVNFQVGDLRQLPLPTTVPDELRLHVTHAIELTRQLDTFDETSPDFSQPAPWDAGDTAVRLQKELADVEQQVDRISAGAYGIAHQPITTAPVVADIPDTARRWISWALGIWLGRWSDRPQGEIAILSPLDPMLATSLRRLLAQRAGEPAASQIETAVGGLEKLFSREFLPWHNRLYRFRPVFWGFEGNSRVVAISSLSADPSLLRSALRTIGRALPPTWQRTDNGTALDLCPLAEAVADRNLQLSLEKIMDSAISPESPRESVPLPPPNRRRAASYPAGR